MTNSYTIWRQQRTRKRMTRHWAILYLQIFSRPRLRIRNHFSLNETSVIATKVKVFGWYQSSTRPVMKLTGISISTQTGQIFSQWKKNLGNSLFQPWKTKKGTFKKISWTWLPLNWDHQLRRWYVVNSGNRILRRDRIKYSIANWAQLQTDLAKTLSVAEIQPI